MVPVSGFLIHGLCFWFLLRFHGFLVLTLGPGSSLKVLDPWLIFLVLALVLGCRSRHASWFLVTIFSSYLRLLVLG